MLENDHQHHKSPNEPKLYAAEIEDISIQIELQPWVQMDYYQMESGSQVAKFEALDLGNQQLVRESQRVGVHKLGCTAADYCTISWATIGSPFRFSNLAPLDDGTVFFMPAETEFDIYVPAQSQTTYIGFSQEAFLQKARALNPSQWESAPQHSISIPATEQAALIYMVNSWMSLAEGESANNEFGDAFCAQAQSEQILETILQMTVASQPDNWRASSPAERVRAFTICRLARAYIDECFALNQLPSITDICVELDVSERTLQYAFRRYVDMSPNTYLRVFRLNQVRSFLRISDPQATTVTKIAMKFGFLHLGRFSADYKKLFNEHPSTTLAL